MFLLDWWYTALASLGTFGSFETFQDDEEVYVERETLLAVGAVV